MPIYEYQCANCGHQFDVLQQVSDEPLKGCPKCNKQALKKLISQTSFQLKGTGWYETDFKTKPKKDTPESKDKETKKEPQADKKTDSTKADAKPKETTKKNKEQD